MRRTGISVLVISAALAALSACNTGPKDGEVRAEPKATAAPAPSPSPAPALAPSSPEGALHLGAPIEATAQKVALSDVAKNPSAFVGKKFATTGTVTAVCQHMGCWMEIKDESGEAHIKMAGHSFFVPKTASGHKARVLATLVKSDSDGACGDEGMAAAAEAPKTAANTTAAPGAPNAAKAKSGCRAEAEAQLGRPLAKLELVADGVELM